MVSGVSNAEFCLRFGSVEQRKTETEDLTSASVGIGGVDVVGTPEAGRALLAVDAGGVVATVETATAALVLSVLVQRQPTTRHVLVVNALARMSVTVALCAIISSTTLVWGAFGFLGKV